MPDLVPYLITAVAGAVGGAFAWHYFYTQGAVVEAELKARITSLEGSVLSFLKIATPAIQPQAPPPAPPPKT